MRKALLLLSLVSGVAAAQTPPGIFWNPGSGYFGFDGGTPPFVMYPLVFPGGTFIDYSGNLNFGAGAGTRNAGIGGLQPLYSVAEVGDFDSLLPSQADDRAYQVLCGANTEFLVASGAPVVGSLLTNSIDANPIPITTGAYFVGVFAPPPGTTSVVLTANMKKGAADTGTTGVGFVSNSACAAPAGINTVSLTSTMTAYKQTLSAPTQNTNYYGGIFMNQPGLGSSTTSDPIIGSIQAKPIGATGVFASDFYRIGASSKTMWNNNRTLYYTDGTYHHQAQASLVFQTDATTLAVEMENTTAAALGLSISIYCNSYPCGTYTPTQNGTPEFATFTVPPGAKTVEVRGGAQTQTSVSFDSHDGVMIRAVYLPASANTYVAIQPTNRALVFHGDSICQGNATAIPSQQGFSAILKRWFQGTVTIDCWGSRSLYADLNNAGGVSNPNLAALVNDFAIQYPTDIWLGLGVNDYLSAGYTLAQFTVANAALMDAMHARMPAATIYAQSLFITGTEGASGANGYTPPQQRTAVSNNCAARPWCRFVDGTTLAAASDISGDNVHPFPGAHSKVARNILNIIEAPALAGSLPMSWNSPAGLQTGTGTLAAGTLAVTFANAYNAAPVCTCSDTTATAAACNVNGVSTTGFTAKGTTTDTFSWICFGNR